MEAARSTPTIDADIRPEPQSNSNSIQGAGEYTQHHTPISSNESGGHESSSELISIVESLLHATLGYADDDDWLKMCSGRSRATALVSSGM